MANTIKIKNSGTASNVPSALEHGELAINYADGLIYYKNSSNVITEFSSGGGGGGASVDVSDDTPSNPSAGDLWYESDTGKTFIYYDSYWVEIGAAPGSSPFISDLDEDTRLLVESDVDEDKIRFDTAGVERMIIDNAGLVGVGTSAPAYTVDVVGTGVKIVGTGATAGGNLLMAPSTGNAFNITSTILKLDASDTLTLEGNTLELSAGPSIGHAVLNLDTSNGTGISISGSNTNRRIAIGNNTTTTLSTAQAVIYSSTNSYSALVLRGASGQTAVIQDWQNDSGTSLASVSSTGSITSSGLTSDGAIAVSSGGTTQFTFPTTDGTNGQVLTTDGNGTVTWTAVGGNHISSLLEDTTPQLGGQLDVNAFGIGDGTRELITFTEDASAVNHINVENEATGSGPILSSAGDDTNVDLNISTQGSGSINLNSATSVTGNISVTGTVDGRDVATDGSKLDGIESGATADQTAADIRGLGFFDTTNHGTGSGLDADLLDGNHASAFATSSQGALADTALQDVADDTTPQLGGALDVNGQEITGAIDLHSTGDVIVELGDAAGTNKISVRDSGATEVASINSDGDISAQDVTVAGTLTVNGTTTTVNSATVTIDDPLFTLGGDTAPGADDNKDRGIEFRWHDGTSAKTGFFGFDDSTGYFTFIPDGTNTSEVYSGTKGDLDINNLIVAGTVDGRDVAADGSKLDGISAGAEVNAVDSVNSLTGAVVLDADDISDAATTNKFTTAADITKLAGIEASADVTDATNVETAIEAITLTSVSGDTGDEVLVVDATDGGLKAVVWENMPFGINNVVEDTTPQLGGALDVNGQEITGAIDLHSTGDVVIELGDAAGTNKVSVRDSGGIEQFLIDSDGNVGVGKTPNSGSRLDVNGRVEAYQNTLQTNNDDYAFITSGNFGGGYGFYEGTNRAVIVAPGGNQMEFFVGGSPTSWGTMAIDIDASGNVTIPVTLNGVDPDNFADMTGSTNAGRKITVSTTQPSSPTTGDVWIDIS